MNKENEQVSNHESTEWIPFQSVDFSDQQVKSYHIDTRDFHVLQQTEDNEKFDIEKYPKIKKHPQRYFFTDEEIITEITRLYIESGGQIGWRMLSLMNEGKRVSVYWQLKYIRIHRLPLGLIICDKDHIPIMKDIIRCKVDQKVHG
jgi:hypothetical protein